MYQLSKDDFLFIRKGVSVDDVFNAIFLGLPLALLTARIFYVLFHPSWHYLNPLIFFIVPYFPGLSLVGGIVGTWIFLTVYTRNKKIPSLRLLDMVGLAFLLTLSLGILIDVVFLFPHNKALGVEEIGRSVLGIMLYITLLLQFIKGTWIEGSIAFLIVCLYCILSLMNTATLYVLHQTITVSAVIATGVLLALSFILFISKQRFMRKVLGK